MKTLVRKHPLAIRWFHWINFPLLMAMIWSGTLVYWAYPNYRIGFGSHTLVKMTLSQPAWKELLTGLAIYKPVQCSWLATMFGGYQQKAEVTHFCLLPSAFCLLPSEEPKQTA